MTLSFVPDPAVCCEFESCRQRDCLFFRFFILTVCTDCLHALAPPTKNMYVRGSHNFASKKTQRGRRYGKSGESQKKHKRAKEHSDSALKHKYRTIVERCFEGEQYQMRTYEQGYTQSDMEDFDIIKNENVKQSVTLF